MCPSGRREALTALAGAVAPSFRPAFDVLDADRDGKISTDDLRSFYSTLPSCPSEDDICSMISTADADRDGYVQYIEFESVLGSTGGGGVMEEVFRAMDLDGDGVVGFEDLKEYLRMAGMEVEDEDVRAMIRVGGGEESGGVGFQALVKILDVDFDILF